MDPESITLCMGCFVSGLENDGQAFKVDQNVGRKLWERKESGGKYNISFQNPDKQKHVFVFKCVFTTPISLDFQVINIFCFHAKFQLFLNLLKKK